MGNIKIYSSIGLEPWKWDNPDLFGIGGSETSHIEMVKRLSARGYPINSFCPMEKGSAQYHDGAAWWSFDQADPRDDNRHLWIVYRDPKFFDFEKPRGSRWWFIAQDCDYDWTPERLEKVDRYWCLCPTHAEFTCRKYPQIASRVYVTSNGIKRDRIEQLIANNR